jgi:dimethylhistidine N-methyltransferase
MNAPVSVPAAGGQGAALLADALRGLTAARKSLPCKWLYDRRGAALFEAITGLEEYYPTRTEMRILREDGPAIAAAVGPGRAVIELGPGDGAKAVLLLDALHAPAAYVPVDIAPAWLDAAASRVAARFPALPVRPVVADFARPYDLPGLDGLPRLGFFPGSTIGNFAPDDATRFLRQQRLALGAESRLLLGADLVKAPAVLEAAYDDAQGVTAAFNLNLLRRLNEEAGADFDLTAFRHRAVWNAAAEKIEMHLVSRRAQVVTLGGRPIRFAAEESIHTEDSHKYRPDGLRAMAAESGWRVTALWTDPAGLFAVLLLAPA